MTASFALCSINRFIFTFLLFHMKRSLHIIGANFKKLNHHWLMELRSNPVLPLAQRAELNAYLMSRRIFCSKDA